MTRLIRQGPFLAAMMALMLGCYGVGYQQGRVPDCSGLRAFHEKFGFAGDGAMIMQPPESLQGGERFGDLSRYAHEHTPDGMVLWGMVPIGDRTYPVYARASE